MQRLGGTLQLLVSCRMKPVQAVCAGQMHIGIYRNGVFCVRRLTFFSLSSGCRTALVTMLLPFGIRSTVPLICGTTHAYVHQRPLSAPWLCMLTAFSVLR